MVHQLSDAWSIPNPDRWCIVHSRFSASSLETGLPACAYPINRRTRPNPAGVSNPRFSLSAICQICMVSSVSTIPRLLYSLLHSPLLIRLMAIVSFRKTSQPPHQSPHQSFRYPLLKTTGRRDVVRQGSDGGWDALESKDNQLQLMWLHYEGPSKLNIRCTSRCCDSTSAMSSTIFRGAPRRAGVAVVR